MRAMTRIIGQTFSRLASWQGQLVMEIIAKSPELLADGNGERVLELVQRMTPVVGDLHDYVWRRQLAAYFTRIAVELGTGGGRRSRPWRSASPTWPASRPSPGTPPRPTCATCWVRSRRMATEVVGSNRGQIVKTIGDEVLFVADDPLDAAEIAARADRSGRGRRHVAADCAPASRAGRSSVGSATCSARR